MKKLFTLLLFSLSSVVVFGQCATITGLSPYYCSNASPATLTGAPGGGTFSGPGIAGNVFNPAAAGAGTHTITYTLGACVVTQQTIVNAAPTANAGPDFSVCPGGSVTLQGAVSGAVNYVWSPAAGLNNVNILNPICTPTATTTYTLTATGVGMGGGRVYMRSTTGIPWGSNSNETSMTTVFGAGNWQDLRYELNPAATVFVPGNRLVFMEGSDGIATEMETYLTANLTLIQNWVTAGGSLFLNAAPNENNGMPYGFGGVNLGYPNYSNPGNAIIAHPIFVGPYVPVVGPYWGPYFSHGGVTGGGVTQIITGSGYCQLAEKVWGLGHVMFGGMTTTNWHTPQPQGNNLRNNILSYLDGLANAGACVATDQVTVTVLTPPNAAFTATPPGPYCANGGVVALNPTTPGGVFAGPGVTGNTFNPATAGAGTHTITYTLTSPCTSTTSQNLVVNPTPSANFTGLNGPYCDNGPAVTLVPTTGGGTFTGPGMAGNIFTPAVAGPGTHTITYTITIGSCTNTSSQTVTVVPAPDAAFTGLVGPYCTNGNNVALIPNTAGGVFTGPGMAGNVFNPAAAGAGTHTITYTVTVGSCTNTTNQQVTVNPAPNATYTGLAGPYCTNDAPITLTPALGGGTFTGPGMTGNIFDPVVAGAGTHFITYTITTGLCTSVYTQQVIVNTQPDATFFGLNGPYCAGASPVNLTPGTAGGAFTGPGMTGNIFDPGLAGAGTHTITYNVSVGNCSDVSSQTVVVNAQPNATFSGLNSPYCSNVSPVTLTPNTVGGTFSGNGVTGNTFNPGVAGAGTHTITYTITTNNCTSTTSQTVVVNQQPTATFTGLTTPVCILAGSATLTPATAGGSFGGPGVSGNVFNPVVAGVGTHTITYSVTINGCSDFSSQTVVVNAMPNAGFTGLGVVLCDGNPPVTLIPTQNGGTFTGTGVAGNVFSPGVSGTGQFVITYTITVNGCTSTTQQVAVVNPSPVVSFTGLAPEYCGNNAATVLTGIPQGGMFTGPGILGTSFDPVTAGPGTHTITYTYISLSGCSGVATQTTIVHPLPVVTFNIAQDTVCESFGNITLTGGTPGGAGGVYAGPGVTGNIFNPAVASFGNHTITYTYTDTEGCQATASDVVYVDFCMGTDDILEDGNWVLFPNPSHDAVNIRWNGTKSEKFQIAMTDLTGRILRSWNESIFQSGSQELIPVSDLSDGVYIIQIKGEAGNVLLKFVKN